MLQAVGASELRKISDGEGLVVTSLNSAGYFTWPDAARQQQQDRVNLQLIDDAAVLGARQLVVITGGIDGGLDAAPSRQSMRDARARVEIGLTALDRRAAASDVRLGLEPIHPADHLRKGCINSIDDALSLCRALKVTDLVIDTFHSAWDRALLDLRSIAGDRLGCIQVCNWFEPSPEAKPSRCLPDDGRLDLAAITGGLLSGGYAGPIEFEMFDIHRRGRSVESLLDAAHRQISALLEQSDTTEAARAGA
ncbi:hypothetical protein ATO6_10235 [Oceanicola sp. 22II-s10i]|nr:hypothetical protein ATO6_10235 [Oceanicola sp. 22II-s10i]